MSHSAKKIYSSVFQVVDTKSDMIKHFTLFRDTDMGITEYWQVSMIESVIYYLIVSNSKWKIQILII